MSNISNECPYCQHPMQIAEMACHHCDVAVRAAFPEGRLGRLPVEHQRFIEMFLLASGNLKQIAEMTGVSYPTVRSRLDKVIGVLREEIAREAPTQGTLLDAVAEPGPTSGRASRRAGRRPSTTQAETAERLIKSI